VLLLSISAETKINGLSVRKNRNVEDIQRYGEVNSVKKHNYNIWLNDGVY